jgi:hypothetical protein
MSRLTASRSGGSAEFLTGLAEKHISPLRAVENGFLRVCSNRRFADSLFLTGCTPMRNFLVYVVF